MPVDPIHSTGRGGAGNIGADPNTYVDGSVTREGVLGEPGHPGGGDYSSGRGGAGNVVPSPRATPVDHKNQLGSVPPSNLPASAVAADSVPEPAMRDQTNKYDDFHTGRGGQGNVHRDRFGGHSSKHEQDEAERHRKEKEGHHAGLLEKAKHAMGLDKKKEGST